MVQEASTQAIGKPFKKLLLALDRSDRALDIVQVGAYLSGTFGARVVAVTVAKLVTNIGADEFDGSPATKDEEDLKDWLTHLMERSFGEKSAEVEVKVLHGDPAARISEYAEYASCDLIVIGSRGQGPLKRAILGSTSSAVAASSKKPVLILR